MSKVIEYATIFVGPTGIADTVIHALKQAKLDHSNEGLRRMSIRIGVALLNIQAHRDDKDVLHKWVQYVFDCDEVTAKAWIYDQITTSR